MMTSLNAILRQKQHGPITITPETTIRKAVALLAEKRIGAVVVVSAENELVGILSERDVVRSLAANGVETLSMTVAQLMTAHPITATPKTTVFEAENLMTDGHFRHLPILHEGKLIGVVSIGDVVKRLIDEQADQVRNLRDYVAGVHAA
jgi:CBS domain-containing protein